MLWAQANRDEGLDKSNQRMGKSEDIELRRWMVPTGWLVDPRMCQVNLGHWRPGTGKSWPGPINELKGHRVKRCQYSRKDSPSTPAGTGEEVKLGTSSTRGR